MSLFGVTGAAATIVQARWKSATRFKKWLKLNLAKRAGAFESGTMQRQSAATGAQGVVGLAPRK